MKYKFRGRCLDNGEFVTGSLIVLNNEYFIIRPAHFLSKDKDSTNYRIIQIYSHKSKHVGFKIFQVDPDSVAQFIGYDKNGNEIYEGDEIKSRFGSSCRATFRHYGGVIDGAYTLFRCAL